MLSTSSRPIPLRARGDLIIERVEYGGESSWVVKDPVSLRYHRLLDEQHCVLQSLDGKRSLEDLRDALHRQFPALHVNLAQVQSVVTDLYEKGLIASDRPGQAEALIERARKTRRQRIRSKLLSVLYLRLPGWDPEKILARFYPLVRWMFHPAVVAACLSLVVASWILLFTQFEHFRRTMPEFQQFFGWPNLLYLWLTLGVAKILHEFGHGFACKHYGGECHEMGLMLLVFTPCLYCDTSDAWMLKNKWQRIIIASAGMYVEIILAALALFLWWNTESGLLHHLCFNVFLVTTVTTVIFNANPLMRFDGYYIFSDWVEIPNLRAKANKLLSERFAWYCFGIPPKSDPFLPDTGRNWLVVYAVAAALYRWFILFGILLFLYTFLKPYGLQSLGILLAVWSAAGIVGSLLFNVYRILAAPREDPLDKQKLAITGFVLLAVVAAAAFIPFSLHGEVPFLVEPEDGEDVKVTTPGRLIAVHVQPGDRVKKGELLLELENIEKTDRLHRLQNQRKVTLSRIRKFRALQDEAGEMLARERLRTIDVQITELRRQLQQLKITAPCDGVVVAPPHQEQSYSGELHDPLPRWSGTPLDARNHGCFLERRTHLLSVAPSPRLVAVAMITQADRNDLSPGERIELKFDHLPGEVFTSRIDKIAAQHLKFAPEALSVKMDGELPTVTDAQGRERLVRSVFPATVPLEGDAELFRAGFRGRARFLRDRRSAAQWVWRYLRQTFQFRL